MLKTFLIHSTHDVFFKLTYGTQMSNIIYQSFTEKHM